MIISPILGKLSQNLSILKQTRHLRPTIRVGKDKFQLSLDVRQFDKDEIRVKARPECLIIEGKQERKTKTGYVIRQFVRKFKLPQGCDPQKMKSKLSPDGILTITAPRITCDINLPCETLVPIHSGPKQDESETFVKVEGKDPCEKFSPKKPNDPDKGN